MKTLVFGVAQAAARLLMRTPLRRVPGLDVLYRGLYRRLAPSGTAVVEAEGSKFYAHRRDVGIAMFLLTQGVYEPALTRLLRGLLTPGMVFVDGGANIGYFSLLAAQLVGERGRVYAFEPEPTNFELLARSVALNGYANVTALNQALSSARGTSTLYLDQFNRGNPSLASSNVTADRGSVDVQTISLDEFLEAEELGGRIDVIKLDTQGAEGLVLDGARRTLENDGLCLVMEFWPWGLSNLGTDPATLLQGLRKVGFEVSLLDDATGRLARVSDEVALAECTKRERGRGFVTLVMNR